MSRTILITGCSSGIGKALAKAFLANGDRVIATARKVETLQDIGGSTALPLDVNSADSIAALTEQLAESGHSHIDVLINNAGISAMGPILEIPAEKLRGQFETNVIAPVLLTQALFPLLRKSDNAVVVNIGSVSGLLTTPFAGPYCASKAAIHSISDAMRMELAPFGIQVVTVQPGAIESNFGDAAAANINDWLTPDSLYNPIQDGIMARAGASQVNATPASEFAAELVKGLAPAKPKTLQRIGNGSAALPAMERLLSSKIKDKTLSKKFSLDKL